MKKHDLTKKLSELPPLVTNPYLITVVLFSVWMIFFADNHVFKQYRRHQELSDLLNKKKFYIEQIEKTTSEVEELSSNPSTQEKFAREHYWMKRDNEDVFVIVEAKQPH